MWLFCQSPSNSGGGYISSGVVRKKYEDTFSRQNTVFAAAMAFTCTHVVDKYLLSHTCCKIVMSGRVAMPKQEKERKKVKAVKHV